MAMTIEEASKQLDEAVRAVRQLPWGESPPGTARVLAHYEAMKRVALTAVLEEMYQTRQTGWDWQKKHDSLRAKIAALGRADAP